MRRWATKKRTRIVVKDAAAHKIYRIKREIDHQNKKKNVLLGKISIQRG